MRMNQQLRLGSPMGPVMRFAPPGSRSESALRLVYALDGGRGSTGLALAPLADWLVKVRLTSVALTPTELDSALTEILSGIRWPAQRSSSPVAVPVVACATPLKYKRARVIKPDLTQALLGAVLNNVTLDESKPAKAVNQPTVYCSEGKASTSFGVYRRNNGTDGYVLAFSDAGIAASVHPAFTLDGRKGNFAVSLALHDSIDSYPSFNALPEPKQVFDLVMTTAPLSNAKGGNQITLSPISE